MSVGGNRLKSSEDRLREEVKELRGEVRRLTEKLDGQQDELSGLISAVEELRLQGGKSSSEAAEAEYNPTRGVGGDNVSDCGSYSFVQESVQEAPLAFEGPPERRIGASWEFREEVARGIGAFLKRSLNGEPRGSSGRDRVALGSRYYILVRDKAGHVYRDPVQIHSRFSRVKEVCCVGRDWGDSIFVGIPSLREAQTAVFAAGFGWPRDIQ